uniref:Uncharacterized protein n=1 Tax=Arundo donax TaxID=35708 RepID=A0A0A9D4Y2_ARUDO
MIICRFAGLLLFLPARRESLVKRAANVTIRRMKAFKKRCDSLEKRCKEAGSRAEEVENQVNYEYATNLTSSADIYLSQLTCGA